MNNNQMRRRDFLAASTLASIHFLSGCDENAQRAASKMTSSQTRFLASVNLAGPEFGTQKPAFSNQNPGMIDQDYTFNSRATVDYFAQRGIRLFRIPISWERIQPQLKGSLDPEYLDHLSLLLSWIDDAKAQAILDVHNYARYRLHLDSGPRDILISENTSENSPVDVSHFGDLWKRLATKLRDRQSVYAYGLMNEPHGISRASWQSISQSAVEAIRRIDPKTYICVSGNEWASSERFPELNGARPWINDPDDRTIYEAHAYFDSDRSGKYRLSYAEEAQLDPQIESRAGQVLSPFLEWCHANQVPGIIGEMGVPKNDPSWLMLLENAYQHLITNDCPFCYWAAGEWWQDYLLSVQPATWQSALRPELSAAIQT